MLVTLKVHLVVWYHNQRLKVICKLHWYHWVLVGSLYNNYLPFQKKKEATSASLLRIFLPHQILLYRYLWLFFYLYLLASEHFFCFFGCILHGSFSNIASRSFETFENLLFRISASERIWTWLHYIKPLLKNIWNSDLEHINQCLGPVL